MFVALIRSSCRTWTFHKTLCEKPLAQLAIHLSRHEGLVPGWRLSSRRSVSSLTAKTPAALAFQPASLVRLLTLAFDSPQSIKTIGCRNFCTLPTFSKSFGKTPRKSCSKSLSANLRSILAGTMPAKGISVALLITIRNIFLGLHTAWKSSKRPLASNAMHQKLAEEGGTSSSHTTSVFAPRWD